MEDLLYSIGQKSGIYTFMHTSWGWPTIESLHFLGLSLLIGRSACGTCVSWGWPGGSRWKRCTGWCPGVSGAIS